MGDAPGVVQVGRWAATASRILEGLVAEYEDARSTRGASDADVRAAGICVHRAASQLERVERLLARPARPQVVPDSRVAALRAFRDAVMARAGGRCELGPPACVGRPHLGVHAHHVAGRSGAGADEVANGLWVCAEGHGWVHGHPEVAYGRGWMVRRVGAGPVPLTETGGEV